MSYRSWFCGIAILGLTLTMLAGASVSAAAAPIPLDDAQAIWLDAGTLAWHGTFASSYKLLYDPDGGLETAAADLYAKPWKVFTRVTLPLLWPGIIAGLMLAFVISLDDVVITEFVKSGGQDTLPTYMLGQLRRVITPEMNAISTVFLAISVVIVTVFFLVSRKKV